MRVENRTRDIQNQNFSYKNRVGYDVPATEKMKLL
jgi:hypothetical protein